MIACKFKATVCTTPLPSINLLFHQFVTSWGLIVTPSTILSLNVFKYLIMYIVSLCFIFLNSFRSLIRYVIWLCLIFLSIMLEINFILKVEFMDILSCGMHVLVFKFYTLKPCCPNRNVVIIYGILTAHPAWRMLELSLKRYLKCCSALS